MENCVPFRMKIPNYMRLMMIFVPVGIFLTIYLLLFWHIEGKTYRGEIVSTHTKQLLESLVVTGLGQPIHHLVTPWPACLPLASLSTIGQHAYYLVARHGYATGCHLHTTNWLPLPHFTGCHYHTSLDATTTLQTVRQYHTTQCMPLPHYTGGFW